MSLEIAPPPPAAPHHTKTSEWKRAGHRMGGGPSPRDSLRPGFLLEKAWIPPGTGRNPRGRVHPCDGFRRNRLSMTEGPGPLSPRFSGETGPPPVGALRGAAPRGTGKAPTTRRVRSTPPGRRPGTEEIRKRVENIVRM